MRPIDPYSYHCGVMDSFCEIVGAGVKPMALSHPFASPEERAEYREYAAKMAGQYGVLLAEEDSLPVTPLFPADACGGRMSFSSSAARLSRSGTGHSGTAQQNCAAPGNMICSPGWNRPGKWAGCWDIHPKQWSG